MNIIMKDQKTTQDKAYFKPESDPNNTPEQWCNQRLKKEVKDPQSAIIGLMIFVLIVVFFILPAIAKHNSLQCESTYPALPPSVSYQPLC